VFDGKLLTEVRDLLKQIVDYQKETQELLQILVSTETAGSRWAILSPTDKEATSEAEEIIVQAYKEAKKKGRL
jgi:hypothetical protein